MPGQTARRVRAPAEAKNKHRISGFVDLGDFGVAIFDLLPKTRSECAPHDFDDRIPTGADSVIIERHLIGAESQSLI